MWRRLLTRLFVWHTGLLHKISEHFPKQLSELLGSYLTGRMFRVKFDNEFSELKEINAGVPQGSVLGPILYLIFTNDIPNSKNVTIATFADDTAILVTGENTSESTKKLQSAIKTVNEWTKRWEIKLNKDKSVLINFTNKRVKSLPVYLNNKTIPYANTAKYLGMNLDAKLHWKEHIKKKREEINIKYNKMLWLLGRRSQVSIGNKVLIYNQLNQYGRMVCSYGAALKNQT